MPETEKKVEGIVKREIMKLGYKMRVCEPDAPYRYEVWKKYDVMKEDSIFFKSLSALQEWYHVMFLDAQQDYSLGDSQG